MLADSHILITGANGFVGRHLSKKLLASGARVSELIRSTELLPYEVVKEQYLLDLVDSAKVMDLFTHLEPDYVIHLAGLKTRVNDTSQFFETYNENLSMSLNVIGACRSLASFKKLIFIGTSEEYGQALTPYEENQKELPTSAYGLSKLAVTQILSALFHSQQFPSVVLRPTVIYGPGQGEDMFLPALVQSLLAGKDFAMTAGEQRRDFIYIDDVVDAIIKALNANERANGKIVNIGAGVSYQIKEIAALVENLINPATGDLIKFGAVLYRPNEVMDYSVVITRAKELLDWHPSTTLEEGIRHVVTQFKEAAGNCMCKDQGHA